MNIAHAALRGERPASVHDLRPWRRDQRHPAGRPGHHL